MKKTVIFLIALCLTLTLLTATPAMAHWGFFWPGFALGVGVGTIFNPYFYSPGYYYPAPAPYYYYPYPPYYYGGYYGYYGGYHGEHHGGFHRDFHGGNHWSHNNWGHSGGWHRR